MNYMMTNGKCWNRSRTPIRFQKLSRKPSAAVWRWSEQKQHIKAKATAATEIVTKVHEWTDPNTVLVYAYEEDGEETGKTVRVDFLFTLKFDEARKLKIVKTQQLSEKESQKYGRDSQN